MYVISADTLVRTMILFHFSGSSIQFIIYVARSDLWIKWKKKKKCRASKVKNSKFHNFDYNQSYNPLPLIAILIY